MRCSARFSRSLGPHVAKALVRAFRDDHSVRIFVYGVLVLNTYPKGSQLPLSVGGLRTGAAIMQHGFRVFRLSGRLSAILMTFGIGVGLTLGLFFFVNRWEHRQQQAEFDYVSEPFVNAIHEAAKNIELTHEVLRQDFYASDVSREEFSMCAEPFLARLPSLKVLQWAPRVTQSSNPIRRDDWFRRNGERITFRSGTRRQNAALMQNSDGISPRIQGC